MRAKENIADFGKLTRLWLGVVFAMVGTLVVLQAWLEYDQLEETVLSEASVVGANAAAAIVFNDRTAASEMLAAFHASESIGEAALYRGDGSLLAEYWSSRLRLSGSLGEQAPEVGRKWSWSEYRLVLPVYQDENQVGTIALRASLDNYYLEVFRFAGGLAAISGLAIGFASYATGRLRRRLAEKEAARRHAEAELAQSRDQLRRMMGHREHLLEEEHKRIAVEIHDQLGQVLTAAMLNLRSLERGLDGLDDDAKRQFAEVLALLNESYYGMKNIATLLYPAALKFGFAPAVEWIAGRLLKHAGLHWRVETDPNFPAIDPERSMALFRIVQEALVNVVRHAGAKDVRIGLRCDAETVTVEIEDDGRGFDAKAQPVGFGLIGMRERAEFLTGHVTITSRPGEGTCVRVSVPHPDSQKPAGGEEEERDRK